MAKLKTQYVCQSCGTVASKWQGQCDGCGEWNTLSEEQPREVIPKGLKTTSGRVIEFDSLASKIKPEPRSSTNISEFDRVLGGGLVAGSAILLGGDPGIGKSTILMQMAAKVALQNKSVAYISGEESITQLQLRAERLGLSHASVQLASATNVGDIINTIEGMRDCELLIIDSIQTMFIDTIESAPGSVSQVRGAGFELIRLAKSRNIVVVLVGHVTKDGQIAGPKLLEHMVDTVLYFEGERGHQFRILRSVKNRFGGTNEIGVFEMTNDGLAEVTNPSSLFISQSDAQVSGSAIFAGIEGSRPILVEVQALVADTYMASPRRAVVGWDNNRLAMILAVLDARAGLKFGDQEVYLNIAGGLRITEPATDLAVAAALLSSFRNIPLPKNSVFFGEIGLSGEIRQVSQMDARLKEAEKLGFETVFMPKNDKIKTSMNAVKLEHVRELADIF
jgi:DNA repair protein RadA/Sms